MRLSKPKQVTFILAVLTAVLAVIARLGNIPTLAPYAFWLLVFAFVILMLGNVNRGM
ncbi:MAG: hypothetical protein ACKOC5_18490 [Chloroflexota bacterium]